MHSHCVLYKLHDPGHSTERKNFIRSDKEIALSGSCMVSKDLADFFKNLLHDSILSEIIMASFELFGMSAVRTISDCIWFTSCLKSLPSEHLAVKIFGALSPFAIRIFRWKYMIVGTFE